MINYYKSNQNYKYNIVNINSNIKKNSVSISYNKINNIINNLDQYYKNINSYNAIGGNKFNNENKNSLKLKKYKKFIENSKKSITYFKNAAKQYYSAYYNLNLYYSEVLRQLKIKNCNFR